MSRTLRPLAALAMVALISAGWSNAPAETGTGSSGGNNTAATHEQAVKFAECMRDNGVREFPDPDASGEFVNGIKRGSSLDPSTAAWKTAIGRMALWSDPLPVNVQFSQVYTVSPRCQFSLGIFSAFGVILALVVQ
jgi:hypothetical protein